MFKNIVFSKDLATTCLLYFVIFRFEAKNVGEGGGGKKRQRLHKR